MCLFFVFVLKDKFLLVNYGRYVFGFVYVLLFIFLGIFLGVYEVVSIVLGLNGVG